MKETLRYADPNFNPQKPDCPNCRSLLREDQVINTVRYEDKKLTIHIYVCWCRTATGVVVSDVIDPNDPHVIVKI